MYDKQEYYARKNGNNYQTLEEHIKNVKELCKKQGKKIGMEYLAEYIGGMHDIGKATQDWQTYLNNPNPTQKLDHSTAAIHVSNQTDLNKNIKALFGYVFSGHHGGLKNREEVKTRYVKDITKPDPKFNLDIPINIPNKTGMVGYMRMKMLHSILVDADITDARQFEGKQELRFNSLNVNKLFNKLNNHVESLSKNKTGILQELRTKVYNCCVCEGKQTKENGIFKLTVPTGGGKTLSSMAFALQHAQSSNKERILYVIPYTSIIEQTAQEYRGVFGGRDVLEYHSNVVKSEGDLQGEVVLPTQDISWNSPIVLTTAVQFLDSIFGSNNMTARKIHNIANSVIVFDEAQKLPYETRKVIMDMLKVLVKEYNCSIVFCTATQPNTKKYKNIGDIKVKEIIPSKIEKELFKKLKRTIVYKKPVIFNNTSDFAKKIIKKNTSTLIITNTIKASYDIAINIPNVYYLSGHLYPLHRKRKINEIKKKLSKGEKVICVTTNLIEAGVDISFPIVWRELTSFDSIIQAAGRCNREGELKTKGKVNLFEFINNPYPFNGDGHNTKIKITRDILTYSGKESLLHTKPMVKYMDRLETILTNTKGESFFIDEAGEEITWFDFKDIAKELKVISNIQRNIFVITNESLPLYKIIYNYDKNDQYVPGYLLRKLRQFVVSVYPQKFEELFQGRRLVLLHKNLDIYVAEKDMYDPTFGLTTNNTQPPLII